jgi:hypothetical protein
MLPGTYVGACMFVTLTVALLVSVVAAVLVVFLTGGGLLTALLAAATAGYFTAGLPGTGVGVIGVVGISVLVLALGGEVGPEEHLGFLSIALIAGLFLVGGTVTAIAGVIGLAMVGIARFRRAMRRHHQWLEPRVAAVIHAYEEGRADDLTSALAELPDEVFNQGCKTCLALLGRTQQARRDLGATRWFVNEYGYSLGEAWVIVREYRSDRAHYEEQRQRAVVPTDERSAAPLTTEARFAVARAAIERARRPDSE